MLVVHHRLYLAAGVLYRPLVAPGAYTQGQFVRRIEGIVILDSYHTDTAALAFLHEQLGQGVVPADAGEVLGHDQVAAAQLDGAGQPGKAVSLKGIAGDTVVHVDIHRPDIQPVLAVFVDDIHLILDAAKVLSVLVEGQAGIPGGQHLLPAVAPGGFVVEEANLGGGHGSHSFEAL